MQSNSNVKCTKCAQVRHPWGHTRRPCCSKRAVTTFSGKVQSGLQAGGLDRIVTLDWPVFTGVVQSGTCGDGLHVVTNCDAFSHASAHGSKTPRKWRAQLLRGLKGCSPVGAEQNVHLANATDNSYTTTSMRVRNPYRFQVVHKGLPASVGDSSAVSVQTFRLW